MTPTPTLCMNFMVVFITVVQTVILTESRNISNIMVKRPRKFMSKTLTRQKKLRTLGYSVIEKWSCQWKAEKTADTHIAAYVETIKIVEPLNVRKLFFRGRTNMVCLHHIAEEDEEIRYIDITSLYPWVNKLCKYPVRQPTFILNQAILIYHSILV